MVLELVLGGKQKEKVPPFFPPGGEKKSLTQSMGSRDGVLRGKKVLALWDGCKELNSSGQSGGKLVTGELA